MSTLLRIRRLLGDGWFRVWRWLHRFSRRPGRVGWLAAAAFVLGLAGWWGKDGVGLLDGVYRTLQLFVLQADVTEISGPLLQIARFLAPFAAATTVWALAELLFRPEHGRLKRSHVVVCGLGKLGYGMTRALTEEADPDPVVVIERDPDNPLLEAALEDGAVVLIGDARTDEMLNRARVDRARRVIVVAGEDGVNAEIGAKVRAKLGEQRGRITSCEVHIVEPALWRQLGQREIEEALRGQLQSLDYFNVYSRGARLLLEQIAEDGSPFLASRGGAAQHLVIVGSGRFARSLIVRATRRAARLEQELWITLVGPHAEVRKDRLLVEYSALSSDLETHLIPVEVPVLSREFTAVPYDADRPPPTVVCVSLDDESASVVTALLMDQLKLAGDAPIYVRMRQDAGLAFLLPDDGKESSRLRACGKLEKTCREFLVTGGMFGDMARRLHQEYVRERESAGETQESNPLLVAWEDHPHPWRLHKTLRVQSLLRHMEGRGYECRSTLALDGQQFRFTDEEVAELAEAAYQDYRESMHDVARVIGPMRPRERKWAEVRQDVPWAELDPAMRDREEIRVKLLPEVLAEEGISVERSATAAGAQRPARAIPARYLKAATPPAARPR